MIKKASSNEVITNVPAEPDFEIEKLQAIQGSGAGFTKAGLQGATAQTVDYEVIVRNTGNVPLKLSALADANCGGISPAGNTELLVGRVGDLHLRPRPHGPGQLHQRSDDRRRG